MKALVLLACLCLGALPHATLSANPSSSQSAVVQNTPVRLSITNNLVKDLPLALTATTVDNDLRFTFGPKADGQYCTLELTILRLKDGAAKITATFMEETQIIQADGNRMTRNVGFGNLSTILSPGDEETLFSLGEKKFTVKLLKAKN